MKPGDIVSIRGQDGLYIVRVTLEHSNLIGLESLKTPERFTTRSREQLVSLAARSLGSIKSKKKAAASRENGKKGGRPRTKEVQKLMKQRNDEFIKVMGERGNEK